MDLANVASSGNIELIKSLVNTGADVNERSKEGFLPLCNAAFWGYSHIVDFLLNSGADINLTNSGTGWTACHCAAFQAHGKVLMKLMAFKPDLTIRDSMGRTAADFASALDVIWPFFAAEGCIRTSKADLIRLGVVRKVPDIDDSVPVPKSDLAFFSRPGSAYVMKGQSLHAMSHSTSRDSFNVSAAQMGDVLCLEEDEPSSRGGSYENPKFSVWKD